MAEESIDSVVTPEKIEFDSKSRASIGSYLTGDSSRSCSSEKPDSVKISQPIVPHYLRASTGSCHDFCKYGRRDSFPEKPWKPLPRKTAKSTQSQPKSAGITVSSKQKTEKIVKHEPSTNTKKHSPEVKKPSRDIKSYSPKLRTSLDAKTYSARQNGSSSNETRLSKYKSSPIKKTPSSGPPEIIKTGSRISLPSEKAEVQDDSIDNKISRTEKKTDDRPVSKRLVKVGPSSSSDNLENGKKTRKVGKKTFVNPVVPLSPKLLLSNIASTKSRNPGKLVSPLKNQEECEMKLKLKSIPDGVEKIVTGKKPVKQNHKKIVMKSSKGVVPDDKHRSPVKLKFRSGKVVDVQSDNNTPRRLKFRKARVSCEEAAAAKLVTDKNETGPVKENQNKILKKSREDKYRSPVKLFKNGKLSGAQWDNNTNVVPWRLKFRRVISVGPENAKGDSGRRILKKGGAKNDAAGGGAHTSEKVVLKHQIVQGKKEARVCYNNVIEETASKLVESRKSKVKALVGAFETVISLQERKLST